MGKRRSFTSEFKVKVVLEVLREERTLGEIAASYQINPNQLSNWRSEFLAKAKDVFEQPKAEKERKKAEREAIEEKDRLLKTIGQLTIERDYLQGFHAQQEEKRRYL